MKKTTSTAGLIGMLSSSSVVLAHTGSHVQTGIGEAVMHLLAEHGYLALPILILGAFLLNRRRSA